MSELRRSEDRDLVNSFNGQGLKNHVGRGRGSGILRQLFLAPLGAQPVRELLPAAAYHERQDLASAVFLRAVCPSRCVGSAVPTLLTMALILTFLSGCKC
jgi:hypothetical protein